jgi:hypothetical protein
MAVVLGQQRDAEQQIGFAPAMVMVRSEAGPESPNKCDVQHRKAPKSTLALQEGAPELEAIFEFARPS